ncbi:PH domain-containing protein [Amycolatopsis arida]|uniref:PH domain-containing protein n=1 Tax=Amycolatopsis arida TaxID=587909 RepID=A0A1I5Z2X7_9PSEU|nr:PH domain-containing protein [Amycolatopsis arida]TDX90086.1 PH (Pleckstrin Homology) domain-containing protein [Amycolatopsis arida]SFQ50836.1 PH domain-containing protein [Amycolatopsis arida]
MTVAPDEQVVLRPRRVVWLASVLAVVLVTVFVVVALLLRHSDTGVIFQVSDQVAMIGIGVLMGAASMLLAMPRARADADGIEVRNVLTTRRFRWSEVLAVTFPDGAAFARLELPDDEYHPVLAVQAVDRERAVAAVRALRRLHRRAHGG